MQVAAALSLWHEQENQQCIDSGEDCQHPVKPAPALGSNQEATGDGGQSSTKAQPEALDSSLGSTFMKEEEVIDGVDTQRLTCTG
jgi:hypothetical protein